MKMELITDKPQKDFGVDMWRVYMNALHQPSRIPELMHIYERYTDIVRETNYTSSIDAYVGFREQENIELFQPFDVFDFYLNKYMYFRIVEFDKNGTPKIVSYNEPVEGVW